jgi:hypothetical protein
MARHEHLTIYKAALDMTVHFEKLVAGFSRYHKYTLGYGAWCTNDRSDRDLVAADGRDRPTSKCRDSLHRATCSACLK